LDEPLAQAFQLMHTRNRGSAVTRVENVPEELVPELNALGYRTTPKDPDYLYLASDLAALPGNRYKSQRAACNRVMRTHHVRYVPYREADRQACLALYQIWAAQQKARGLDAMARHMLADAESAHRQALVFHKAIGLEGRIVWVDGAIRAYTFGYERSSSVFCILLEVADRAITGLAQFTFREFCREAADRGYRFINTMDDSGLLHLQSSKLAYCPVRLVRNYIATEFSVPRAIP
jgi:hypothetical protein